MIRTLSLAAVIASMFSFPGASPAESAENFAKHAQQTIPIKTITSKKNRNSALLLKRRVKKLAGPYAALVRHAAKKAHISPVLVAAVVYVENGGNFQGSATRVSSAGAIGVMQLEPVTAWDVLRVNPWQAPSNIEGGTRFLSMLIQRFDGNRRLALMAYNAGPTLIANGGRPAMAVRYANEVLQLTREVSL